MVIFPKSMLSMINAIINFPLFPDLHIWVTYRVSSTLAFHKHQSCGGVLLIFFISYVFFCVSCDQCCRQISDTNVCEVKCVQMIWVRVMVFNATFSNISVISWRSVYMWWKPEYQEKAAGLYQVTDKLFHIMLYGLHLTTSVWSN